jgi:hypothetical protein
MLPSDARRRGLFHVLTYGNSFLSIATSSFLLKLSSCSVSAGWSVANEMLL